MKHLFICDNATIKWRHEGRRYCLHIQQDENPEDPRCEDRENRTVIACFHKRHRLGDKRPGGVTSPTGYMQYLVRKNVSNDELVAAIKAGKLDGIRIAKSCPGNNDLVDIYETSYLRTIFGNSEATEDLEHEDIHEASVSEYLIDDLTIEQCLTLLEPHMEWMPLWLYDHSGITISCGTRTGQFADRWDSCQIGWVIALRKNFSSTADDSWREQARNVMKAEVELYDQYLRGEVYGFTLYEDLAEDGEDPAWDEIDSCWNFYGDDLLANGIADEVGFGLKEALESDHVEEGTAQRRVCVSYTF